MVICIFRAKMSPKRMLKKDWNSFILNAGFLPKNPVPDSSGNSFSNVMYAIGYLHKDTQFTEYCDLPDGRSQYSVNLFILHS